ncbi:glycosyltransferase family 4 protein [Roseisalinus antarcticus]|uniref:GDP-mannose-dependent alpha-(1-6)-phosphatidylinositol monomannoside mannosyltransferase n=1 Tax=Roseisalinus antarcticus TaxID=254357 RepID=A0A1Y5TNK1_9RHOB|nr:glycosyltransferase family 4 protein [Roseisalinus antarcticus]SLN66065.1 GDP-mannose-dependent alpha-(1-6)-phosphatidylinositol monomannoside mannosyltransferase [Roseisalinus antarcticus]
MANRPTPAIFFHPDAVETEGKELVGRRSAGESFLRGWLRHAPGEKISAVTQSGDGAHAFQKRARELGETRPLEVHTLKGEDFTGAGTVFFPAPGYLSAAWTRQRFGAERCSLVGITHTVSTRRVIEGLHNLLSEPVEPWDAIICTSRAVQSVVRRQLDLEVEYFQQRFGASRVPLPRLPLIPLGINADDFARTDAFRAEMRGAHGADDDAFVVLTVGRLTMVEKANMVPLFQVLEELAGRIGRPVHLWMVGWSSRESEKELHVRGAADIAPSVKTSIIDGRAPDVRRKIWSGADVFTLPVDNIQETFGLVPVEAMAAGLPVIMPDWNGFRDTVVHGETGYLIQTRFPAGGFGRRVAERFADGTDDYLRYLSMIQQHTAIDLAAYLGAFQDLANDPDIGHRMGEAGARHVRERLDWKSVVPQYLDLAEDLADRREGARATTPRLRSGPLNPLEVDPFDLYADYPTDTLKPTDTVRLDTALTPERLTALDAVNGRALYKRKVLADEQVLQVQAALPAGEAVSVEELAGKLGLIFPIVAAALLFLAKHGAVRLPPSDPRP